MGGAVFVMFHKGSFVKRPVPRPIVWNSRAQRNHLHASRNRHGDRQLAHGDGAVSPSLVCLRSPIHHAPSRSLLRQVESALHSQFGLELAFADRLVLVRC